MLRRNLRNLARWYLLHSWAATLSHGDRVRLFYWGATGNSEHNNPYLWVEAP